MRGYNKQVSSSKRDLLSIKKAGLYCEAGDFYIDPWGSVEKAVITHAHADHARSGSQHYLAHEQSAPILHHRLGSELKIEGLAYGQTVTIRGVKVSLHPAGHVLGSAQVRVEYEGKVWVVSGDYKLDVDGVSTPFEPVKCDVFISECTFGLPVFRWAEPATVHQAINTWWAQNAKLGVATLLVGYSLGKMQRLVKYLDTSIGPVVAHGSISRLNEVVRGMGIELPEIPTYQAELHASWLPRAMVLLPPSALDSPWQLRMQPQSVGYVSGWMQMRGVKRRRALDQGFVLSDHADWEDLQIAIKATGAQRVIMTHGYTDIFSRWLQERGYESAVFETLFSDESTESTAESSLDQQSVTPSEVAS